MNALVAFVTVALITQSVHSQLQINAPIGTIIGRSDGNSRQYLGIPYAQAPIGPLRWMPPVAANNFNQTFTATTAGFICPQFTRPGASPVLLPQSEDCLNLNVYVPVNASSNSSLPVRIFIHGGGYVSGAGIIYGGSELAALSNSIIVTINYRLDIFGFGIFSAILNQTSNNNNTTNSNSSYALNFGYQDQQLAFRWVQRNIGAFGGNPSNVLIFGQSVGGISVAFHLLYPSSYGLYQKAILESPAYWSYPLPSVLATYNDAALDAVSNITGCNSTNLACLRNLSVDAFRTANILSLAVLDTRQISDQPLNLFSTGNFNKVPVLMGYNRDEGTYLYSLGITPGFLGTLLRDIYRVNVTSIALLEQAYGVSLLNPGPSVNSTAVTNETIFVQDFTIIVGTQSAAASIANNTGVVYLYEFTHTPRQSNLTPYGATHMAELPFVFYNQRIQNTTFVGDEIQLAQQIVRYWTNFHLYSSPNAPLNSTNTTTPNNTSVPVNNTVLKTMRQTVPVALPTWPQYFTGDTANDTGGQIQSLDIPPFASILTIIPNFNLVNPLLLGLINIPNNNNNGTITGTSGTSGGNNSTLTGQATGATGQLTGTGTSSTSSTTSTTGDQPREDNGSSVVSVAIGLAFVVVLFI